MSHPKRRPIAARWQARAPVFAALGDQTRLQLLAKLSSGEPHSISQLTSGSRLTRQAITKHLHVLEKVGVVRCVRSGRQMLYEFDPQPIAEVRDYLESVSKQWEDALGRLKKFVEE